LPLWIAFVIGRRAANRRYTYGFGRAEDLAGLFVVAMIGLSALVAAGLHARTDGMTSLAVVLGAAGVVAGFPLADPLIGLVITIAILAVRRTAAAVSSDA
jgi:divalent metal cation (Fe/Co/Zn/Cd) transporter